MGQTLIQGPGIPHRRRQSPCFHFTKEREKYTGREANKEASVRKKHWSQKMGRDRRDLGQAEGTPCRGTGREGKPGVFWKVEAGQLAGRWQGAEQEERQGGGQMLVRNLLGQEATSEQTWQM